MPEDQWYKTQLKNVPGATQTSILPRILSYAERFGCSEARGGSKSGSSQVSHCLAACETMPDTSQTPNGCLFIDREGLSAIYSLSL